MWRLLMVVMTTVVALTAEVRGYPDGAPQSACGDMFPQGHGVNAQDSPPPYTLTATPTTVAAGDTVTLTVATSGDPDYDYYEGVFVQARLASCETDDPLGTFTVPDNNHFLKLLPCNGVAASSVTHKTHSHQNITTFTWTVPDHYLGRFYFRATVVKSEHTFWTDVFSAYVTYANDTSPTPAHYCAVRSTHSSSVPGLAASLLFAVFITSVGLLFNM